MCGSATATCALLIGVKEERAMEIADSLPVLLRTLVKLLNKDSDVACRRCGMHLVDGDDIFSVSDRVSAPSFFPIGTNIPTSN